MLLFIVDDLFGIKLWGENIFRRVLHHLSNNNFNSNKNNLIHRVNNLLSFETINQLKTLKLPNYNRLNNSFFAKYEGNYSKKKHSLFYRF